MLKLTVSSGAQMGMEFSIDRPLVSIGRGSGNDIILQDSQASRKHAEISLQGDQYYIRDLGSTNGTYVNGRRITGPHPLQPGDTIQIGDTVLVGASVGAPAAAVPTDGWESDLFTDQVGAQTGSRKGWLVWGVIGAVAVLLLAAAAAAAWMLLGGGKATPTPIVVMATNTPASPTEAVVVLPTDTAPPQPQSTVAPTNTPPVQVETPAVAAPTVTVAVPPPGKTAPPPPPMTPPVRPPIKPPTSPEDLEKLPEIVREYLGDIPPDQLPQAIAQQMQSMSQEEIRQMIGALFPGVPLEQLPEVVAASFPGLSAQEVEGLMAMVFPGQNFEIPTTELGAPIGGKMALGIFDKSRGAYDLYLADQAMAQPRLLTQNATDPSFSPDGQYIVYHSSAPDKSGLRIMKADGSEDRTLTSIASDRNPRFSPDGTRVLFSNIDNNTLVVINVDGSGRREIGHGAYPDWSPDGTHIVYKGCVGGGRCGLIVANADGSNPMQITTDANDTMPRWRYGNIAFMSTRDGNFEIYVINPDGTWLRRITTNPATDIMPVWDPDGVRLAFRSDRDGDRAVYTTSGIGGGDFKRFSAEFNNDWMLAGMDWGK